MSDTGWLVSAEGEDEIMYGVQEVPDEALADACRAVAGAAGVQAVTVERPDD